ncbi:MAG: GYD domain-containing protein [Chloroflexi bacterium]|nr:GYD domain-containing protein [Chloroflexota bacterium]
MATFILLSRLTDEGAQTITQEPERIRAVNHELERMGVRVLSQWAVLGPYDFVNVVEASDVITIARVSAELSSRGTVRIMTLPAVPMDEFIAGLQRRGP